MSFNQAPRRKFSKRQRAEFFLAHNGICYWCKEKIGANEPFDIEHVIARELLPDGKADDDENLDLIHRLGCHKTKTAQDAKIRAKSNRIRRKLDPSTRKPKKPIVSRGFSKTHRPFKH